MSLTALNGFLLLLPAIVWNLVFARHLSAAGFRADALVPAPILVVEGALRLATFLLPLLLPLVFPMSRPALVVLVLGYALYFASWVPHLWYAESALAQQPVIILGPALTPLLVFLAIAALTQSWLYALLSLGFIAAHVTHMLYSFELVR